MVQVILPSGCENGTLNITNIDPDTFSSLIQSVAGSKDDLAVVVPGFYCQFRVNMHRLNVGLVRQIGGYALGAGRLQETFSVRPCYSPETKVAFLIFTRYACVLCIIMCTYR
jgi:hypothetical protein